MSSSSEQGSPRARVLSKSPVPGGGASRESTKTDAVLLSRTSDTPAAEDEVPRAPAVADESGFTIFVVRADAEGGERELMVSARLSLGECFQRIGNALAMKSIARVKKVRCPRHCA